MADEGNEVLLQVAGAAGQDIGKGVARLSAEAMKELGLRGGEAVQLEGKRKSAALALPPYEEDGGLSIVRLDGLERHNAGVSIGDKITVRAADAKPARRAVLAPAHENVRLSGPGEALKGTLAGRPVAAGNVISTSVYRQAPGMDGGPLPSDVMRALYAQRAYGLQEIRLVVVSTKPGGIVRITPETEIELRAEHTEPEERVLDVTYDDVGGIRESLEQIREMIELPLKHPELFQRLGIDPPKGVLLFGPPGTGKTLLARAVANESDAHFISVAGPEIMGKMVGESEERLRGIFEEAQKNAPAIVFFDEIDALTPERGDSNADAPERVVSQLLTELDGLERLSDVTVVAATNRPDRIDPALLRPGRLERLVEVPLPDEEARAAIFRVHTRDVPTTNLNFDALARETEGFTGSDIEAVIREASLSAMEEYLSAEGTDAPQLRVEARHLRQALDAARPSITQSMRQYYDGLSEKLRQ
ncbi:MAG TPA: AAA family ATPase [Sandaracinaceae bacterium LLY-WYZ-13_1]|nr:AAA family ATPase [Sandaracinaceae bacterium LLY-WYZ-13_1]